MLRSTQTIIVALRYGDYSDVEVSDEDWAFANQRIRSILDELGARILFAGAGSYLSDDTGTSEASAIVAELGEDTEDLALDTLHRQLSAQPLEYLIRPGR